MNSVIDIEAVGHYYNSNDQARHAEDKMSAKLRLDICSKLVISSGNVQLIKADAIVVPFSVQMTPSSSCTGAVLKGAGNQVHEELQLVKEHERCQHSKRFHTTQTIDLSGGALHVKKIIGVVTPSYSKKYDSALVSALSNCFVNTLTRAVDTKSRTVAFAGMFDSVCRAGYDRVIATHIGLQACKKFLNKYGQKFDHVLFFALNAEELSMFESLMPLYFPRNTEEYKRSQKSLKEMQKKFGRKGAAFSKERKMRVTAMPGVSNDKRNDKSANGKTTVAPSAMNPIDRLESTYTLTSYSPIHESLASGSSSYSLDAKTPNPTPVGNRRAKKKEYTKVKICRAWRVRSVYANSGSKYIAYEINVIRPNKPETKIFRRFSECRELYNKVLDLAYTLGDAETLKTLRNTLFPSRTFWFSNFDQAVIDERLSKLPKIFSKLLPLACSGSYKIRNAMDTFLSTMSETDHDMMRVMRAQEELKESIKTITKTTKNSTHDRSKCESEPKQSGEARKFGKVITNNANRTSGEIAKPKTRKARTGSNTENRNWEDNDEEGFSWNTAERQHEQLKMRRKNRNSKTFLRKVKIVSKSSSGSFDGEGNRFITNESL